MTEETETVVTLFCPACSEFSELQGEVIIMPDAEVKCPECGTVWRIAGLVEVE
jgi:uncharacterized Zn finger protein